MLAREAENILQTTPLHALHLARVGGLQADDTVWAIQRAMLNHLDTVWQKADEGIWETRGGRQQFTFSKVLAWVAYDRAIRSAEMPCGTK